MDLHHHQVHYFGEGIMPLKKSDNAAPDYEAMRAARKLTADENRWLKGIAQAFKDQGRKEMNSKNLTDQSSPGDSEKP
jgi:hypothetical protein